ncbi:MAG: CDP-alcohol phosphatidyltransferase family protein, partial [Betaproteobacteria bacterium]|nr:CDP-alcohol phosphatidyltransferase family protein [Betaproteobacteria bacterium]
MIDSLEGGHYRYPGFQTVLSAHHTAPWLTVPNLITLGRLLLGPAAAWAIFEAAYSLAAWCFIASSVSDWLDGYLARRWNQASRLGALLDPIADNLMTFCIVVVLAWANHLPMEVAMILIARDALILGAAVSSWRLTGTLEFPPSRLGKLHTAVVFTVMSVVIVQMAGWIRLGDLLPNLFMAPVITAVFSGVHYLW